MASAMGGPSGRSCAIRIGDGFAHAMHPRPRGHPVFGEGTIDWWAGRMTAVAGELPILVGLFGSLGARWMFHRKWNYDDEGWSREMIRLQEARRWNWAAWDLNPTAKPCINLAWNHAPTPHTGLWIDDALAGKLGNGGARHILVVAPRRS